MVNTGLLAAGGLSREPAAHPPLDCRGGRPGGGAQWEGPEMFTTQTAEQPGGAAGSGVGELETLACPGGSAPRAVPASGLGRGSRGS